MSDESNGDANGPYRGPARAAPYALSRLSGPVSLVDAAREIERADQWIASTASAQLSVIAEQMRSLREQAERLMQKAQEDVELHRAEARFPRVPGKTYHLYQRENGSRYWSMLSSDDWNGAPPHTYVASYRLEADQSWTRTDLIEARDQQRLDASHASHWLKNKLLP